MNRITNTAELLRKARIAVTCLLYNKEGGWWSPSCILTAVMPIGNYAMNTCLVRAVLTELARGGHVDIITGPMREPMFRWVKE